MIVDRLDRWSAYFSGPAWQRAFDFLLALAPDAEEGYTKLDGDDLYARVMSYDTRGPEQGVVEAHRQFIDIQATLSGAEGIDWFPLESLEVKTPYDASKDAEFYHPSATTPARVDNYPGTFVTLFPGDAHRPQQNVGVKSAPVKKVVVKVHTRLVTPGLGL